MSTNNDKESKDKEHKKNNILSKFNYELIKQLRLEYGKNSLTGSNYKLVDKNKNC